MLIVNPIYDTVFKYLMEDPAIARMLIGHIIGRKVLQLDARPQEQSLKVNEYALTIFRLDYKALIETETGEQLKILIELQKSQHLSDIERFRRYLGENYKATDLVEGESVSLPIVSIYLLGDRLSVSNPLIKVSPDACDLISGERIVANDPFIKLLNHESYFIQIRRLPRDTQHKLASLLSVFDQSRLANNQEKWVLDFTDLAEITDPDLRAIARRLREGLYDTSMLEQVKGEEEIEHQLDQLMRAKLVAEEKAEKARQEAEAVKQEAEMARQEAEVAKYEAEMARQQVEIARQEAEMVQQQAEMVRQQADMVRQEADMVRQQAEVHRRQLVRLLVDMGKSEDEIAQSLGMLPEEVREYLG